MEYYSRCNVCRKISCYTDADLKNNKNQQKIAAWAALGSITNAVAGTRYDMYEMSKTSDRASNKVVDYSKCPECGSIDTVLVTKKFAMFSNQKGNQYTIEDLKNEAYNYLMKKDFENAFCFATMILNEDENNYDSYLIRFLSSYEITKIEDLNNMLLDYSNNQHFLDLVNHASDDQKNILLQQSEKNKKAKIIYDAELLLEKDNSLELVELIDKSIKDIDDNKIINSEVLKKLEEKKYNSMYEVAGSYFNQDNVNKVKESKNLYIKLAEYKDSVQKVDECNKKIEKLIERNKVKNKKIKHVLKNILIIIIVFGIIISSIIYIINVFIPNKKYNDAKQLISEEKYEEAIEKLKNLPKDYSDSHNLLKECYISYTQNLMDNNKFEEAISILEMIVGDYNDVSEILKNCYVLYAKKLTDDSNFEKAISIYEKLGSKDLDNNKLETIYKYGKNLYENKKYEEAYNKFILCDKYEDSKELAKSVAKDYGNQLFDESKIEEALKWFENSADKDLINKAKYAYIESNKYNTNEKTYNFLVELINDNYSDSLDIYNDLYNISCTVIINSSKDDNDSSPSTINQYDNGYQKLYVHYIINGNTPSGKIKIKTLYETRWGEKNIAKKDWSKNKYFTYDSLNKDLNTWQYSYLDMASNLYYHRVIIYNADTGEELARSKEIFTPYNR